ncbi:MAG: gliding motility-associated C-terminal domain-containing protein [Flavobacteriia bacterium]|jgi:gliding motility-associated-like protein
MKTKYRLLLIGCCMSFCTSVLAQLTSAGWEQSYQKARVFIENKGQFAASDPTIGPVAYAIDFGSTRILFGSKGIQYTFLEAQMVPKAARDSLRERFALQIPQYKEQERVVGKFKFKSDAFQMHWVNSLETVQLVAEEKVSSYFSYPEAAHCQGFERLVYKNIYPNIDLEYTVHPQDGLKYAFVVHPGADPSQIAMVYDRAVRLVDGHLEIPTAFGPVIDHAPYSFQGTYDQQIQSAFIVSDQQIRFQIGAYNCQETLVIDPWTQSPNFATNWDVIWECDRDGAGNAYALGGIMPMQILKYSPTGNLLWTYSTPYDTSNVWLGTFAVDNAGNSYVTAGSVAQIQKISPAGALLVNNPSPGGILSSAEFWTISFNCNQSKLVIGGTGGALLQLDAVVYEVNTSNLNISNQQTIATGPATTIPPNIEEVRAITAAPNGRYYFMTMDTIGYLSDNFGSCPTGTSNFYKGPHNAAWGYKLENYRYDNSGICALASDPYHVFMHRGNEIQKRSLQNGSIISTNSIPGGQYSSVFLGGQTTGNSGIAVDDCGNIYVGSTTGVYKFSNGLIQEAFYPTNFAVYDIQINTNGELLACGGTGTSSSTTRSGTIRSLAIGACAPQALTCCDAAICQPQNVCETDAPFQLVVGTVGGTWNGLGVNAQGMFDPSVAGAGVQTVYYTLPCGTDSVQITVSPCTALQVCLESNGQMTVSGGVGPYTWAYYTPASTTPITNQTECQNCGYTWFFGQCINGFTPVTSCSSPAAYVNFATGISVATPSAQTQFQVTDNAGTVYQFTLSQLAPCAANPCAGFSANVLSQTNPTCFGAANGSVSIALANGTAPFTYNWSPVTSTTNSLNNLSAGSYTCTITDANNCSAVFSTTLTDPTQLTISSVTTPTPCGLQEGSMSIQVSGGTAPYTYAWTPAASNTNALSNLGSGIYTVVVTDANACQATISDTVQISNGPQLNESISASSCMSNTGSISVAIVGGTPPYTISWVPNLGNTPTLSGLGPNDTLTIFVSDANDCGASETYVITALNDFELNSWASSTSILEGESVVLNASGALNYSWTPSQDLSCPSCPSTNATPDITTQYIVTGTLDNGCTDQDTLLITVTQVCGAVYVPTICSPAAQDTEDQRICVYGNCIAECLFVIYNRWGEVVFETTDQQQCWDGTYRGQALPGDVFAYKLQVRLQDGTSLVKSGNINLLR